MPAANTKAGKAAKAEARDLPSAAPAGEGIPGTNTASAEKADAEGAAGAAPIAEVEVRGARPELAPPAAGTIDPAAEAAAADLAAKAEAVTPAGGSVAEVLAGSTKPYADLVLSGIEAGAVRELHVVARPQAGFRRAGRAWPAGHGVEVAVADLSKEQLVALLGESELVVTPVLDKGEE